MWWIILGIAALGVLWLAAIRTGNRRDASGFMERWIAHRGLWNSRRPENSLAAFRAAAEAGFGMELDVHLTADGKLAVIHDSSLERMCGDGRVVEECPMEQLKNLRLGNTDACIPALEEVLKEVDGRVPLVIELKRCRRWKELCCRTARMLDQYAGNYCVESFDPRIVRWWRRNRAEVIRGQLVYACRRGQWSWERALLGSMSLNFLGRPDFLAVEAESTGTLPFRIAAALYRPWIVVWTVRSQEAARRMRPCDTVIFEQFVPDEPFYAKPFASGEKM